MQGEGFCRNPRQPVFLGVDILHLEHGKIWASTNRTRAPQPSGPEIRHQNWDAITLSADLPWGFCSSLSRQTNFSHGILSLSASARRHVLQGEKASILRPFTAWCRHAAISACLSGDLSLKTGQAGQPPSFIIHEVTHQFIHVGCPKPPTS